MTNCRNCRDAINGTCTVGKRLASLLSCFPIAFLVAICLKLFVQPALFDGLCSCLLLSEFETIAERCMKYVSILGRSRKRRRRTGKSKVVQRNNLKYHLMTEGLILNYLVAQVVAPSATGFLVVSLTIIARIAATTLAFCHALLSTPPCYKNKSSPRAFAAYFAFISGAIMGAILFASI